MLAEAARKVGGFPKVAWERWLRSQPASGNRPPRHTRPPRLEPKACLPRRRSQAPDSEMDVRDDFKGGIEMAPVIPLKVDKSSIMSDESIVALSYDANAGDDGTYGGREKAFPK